MPKIPTLWSFSDMLTNVTDEQATDDGSDFVNLEDGHAQPEESKGVASLGEGCRQARHVED